MKGLTNLEKENQNNNKNKVNDNSYVLFYISFGALALLILSAQLTYLFMIPAFIFLYVNAENVFKLFMKARKG